MRTNEERDTMSSYSRFNAVNCNVLARSLGWKPSPVDLKRLYDWDTAVTLSTTSDKLTVQGTDVEVEWDTVNKMYCEV
jgi:hypothetical protein